MIYEDLTLEEKYKALVILLIRSNPSTLYQNVAKNKLSVEEICDNYFKESIEKTILSSKSLISIIKK